MSIPQIVHNTVHCLLMHKPVVCAAVRCCAHYRTRCARGWFCCARSTAIVRLLVRVPRPTVRVPRPTIRAPGAILRAGLVGGSR